jgi:general stress protein YciG
MTKAQTLEDLHGQVREEDKMVLNSNARRARGLAAMSPERRREIASKGGRTSQARGTAHQWTAEEASAAGKKGSARYALRRAEMGGMAQ